MRMCVVCVFCLFVFCLFVFFYFIIITILHKDLRYCHYLLFPFLFQLQFYFLYFISLSLFHYFYCLKIAELVCHFFYLLSFTVLHKKVIKKFVKKKKELTFILYLDCSFLSGIQQHCRFSCRLTCSQHSE